MLFSSLFVLAKMIITFYFFLPSFSSLHPLFPFARFTNILYNRNNNKKNMHAGKSRKDRQKKKKTTTKKQYEK